VPTPLPPAPGLRRTPTAPTIGLPAAGGLPPAPQAMQTQRRSSAAGCVGCAVVLMFVALVAVMVLVGMQR
jgi:hypothetical protein